MSAIITVENMSKRYRLGQIGATTLRESAQRLWQRLWGLTPHQAANIANNAESEEFWALKDISFTVRQGEVCGIIGGNGAGKSTLLKILSRVTEPTSGRAVMRGRVASLLEVGTGFHPQLTGRENVYLNGAILGMRHSEIVQKFDEIVAFSEVEKFLDTPVKHYSSGMYVRLAFAVAAHLEPEILIVDEVLAVGDAEFQKKCIGKMGEVAKGGRTVLFVSHNMAAVQQLCSHGVVLERGSCAFDGPVLAAIDHYAKHRKAIRNCSLRDRSDRQGTGRIRFTHVEIVNSENCTIQRVMTGMDIEVLLHYESALPLKDASVQVLFTLVNSMGLVITSFNSGDSGPSRMTIHQKGVFSCKWPKVGLKSGTYIGALSCSINGEIADSLQNGIEINIEAGDYFGSGKLSNASQGNSVFMHSWCSQVDNKHE
jgi:lipopolysaccharide transport system ATP-binding protein